MKNYKLIYLLSLIFFLIFFSNFIFSAQITVNGSALYYTNTQNESFEIKVVKDCSIGDSLECIAKSSKDEFSFNIICSANKQYYGTENDLEISFTEDPNKIFVSNTDEVIFSIINGDYTPAKLIVDDVSPTIGNFSLTSSSIIIDDIYYKNASISSINNYVDYDSGLNSLIVYVVPIAKLENYNEYINKVVSADPIPESIPLNLSQIQDGNYYVLLDVNDNSGNYGFEHITFSNLPKKEFNLDTTPPNITNFSLGEFVSGKTYYVPTSTKSFTISFKDEGVGIDEGEIQLDKGSLTGYRDYNSSVNGFYVYEATFIDGSYKFNIEDLLGNGSIKTFKIDIDNTPPTTPSRATLSKDVDNNVTIKSWGASTDQGSGVKEYKVYRSTSSFTKVTNQTLICSVATTSSCIDTSTKSDNTTYYYGVAAVDHAGNISDVNAASIKTGPTLKITIDFPTSNSNYLGTTTQTPTIWLEHSNDVNAVRLSCNGTTFSNWKETSGNKTTVSDFNIVSGNGCDSKQGDRTLYVEVRSEEDLSLTTRRSISFKYDSVPPTIPANLTAVELSNGTIKLSWSASNDVNNGSGFKEYYIYYAEDENITTSTSYLSASSNTHIFKPNIDKKFYLKVLAVDKAGNLSGFSNLVSATSKRFGASFSLNANPSNFYEDINYLKKGKTTFTISANEILKSTPSVKLFLNSKLLSLGTTPLFNNNILTFEYNFQESGELTLEVTGINQNNEITTDVFYFTVDVNSPDFDVNYSLNEKTSIYNFFISNFSEDIFKVEYLLDNSKEICSSQDLNKDFSCDFNSLEVDDGNYTMHVVVYDYALNKETKTISLEIDNIDEYDVFLKEVAENKSKVSNQLNFFKKINFSLSKKLLDVVSSADEKYEQAVSYAEDKTQAENTYVSANNYYLDALNLFPKINTIKFRDIDVNLNNENYDLNSIILDSNILFENLNFDFSDKLSFSRKLSILQISNQNYYSSSLIFTNTSSEDITISIVEFIPKDFAKNTKTIYFENDVEVVFSDPVVLYNLTIPKNSTFTTQYINTSSVPELGIHDKFNNLEFESPLVLQGTISKDILNLSNPSSKTTNSLFMIVIASFIILIIIVLIFLILSTTRKKENVLKEVSAKEKINKYLGEGKSSLKAINEGEQESIEEKNIHDSNYDYILKSIKK